MAKNTPTTPPKALRIPIADAKAIAQKYGYDQVAIFAMHRGPENPRTHITTYGKTKAFCEEIGVAAIKVAELAGWIEHKADGKSVTSTSYYRDDKGLVIGAIHSLSDGTIVKQGTIPEDVESACAVSNLVAKFGTKAPQ